MIRRPCEHPCISYDTFCWCNLVGHGRNQAPAGHSLQTGTRPAAGWPRDWRPNQVIDQRCGMPFTESGAWNYVADTLESGHTVEVLTLDSPQEQKPRFGHCSSPRRPGDIREVTTWCRFRDWTELPLQPLLEILNYESRTNREQISHRRWHPLWPVRLCARVPCSRIRDL